MYDTTAASGRADEAPRNETAGRAPKAGPEAVRDGAGGESRGASSPANPASVRTYGAAAGRARETGTGWNSEARAIANGPLAR